MARRAIDLDEIVVTPPQGGGGSGTGTHGRTAPADDSNRGPPPNPSTNPNQAKVERRDYDPYSGRAVVVVNGAEYFEWETVQVRLAKYEVPANTFRFTASEREPFGSFAAMRLIPGDKCEIWLDGEKAITGEIVTRQAYYDGTSHTVELQGQGATGRMAESSMVSKTGEWKNIGFDQLARTVASQFGLGVVGTAGSAIKFPRVSTQPAQSAWELLEPHARASNTVMGETADGQLELGTNAGGGARLVERKNILNGREVIHSLKSVGSGEPQMQGGGGGAGSDFKTIGQAPGNDDEWGAMPTHQRQVETPALTTTFNKGFLAKVGLSEVPAWANKQLQARTNMERDVSDEFQIKVTLQTLSWQRSATLPVRSGGLWKPGEEVVVWSPMLVMYDRKLTLKAVTFSQDDKTGTRSTLELVNAAALGGEPQMK